MRLNKRRDHSCESLRSSGPFTTCNIALIVLHLTVQILPDNSFEILYIFLLSPHHNLVISFHHGPNENALIATTNRPQSHIMESDSGLSDLSSELSSVRSVSPPPLDYPSPQSTQENSGNNSSSQNESPKRPRESDDLPPAKKRKSVEAKPRTTVHLDLQSPLPAADQSAQLGLLLKVLRKRRKIVVIAGAGISTAAGGECCAPLPAAWWIAKRYSSP